MHIIVANLYGNGHINLRIKFISRLCSFEGLFQTSAYRSVLYKFVCINVDKAYKLYNFRFRYK